MSIHIGENTIIFEKDIVAIIDKDTVDKSKSMKQFIDNMIKNGYLCNDKIKDVKTYILTCNRGLDENGEKKVKKHGLYLSKISSITLSRRSKNIEPNWGLLVNER